MLWSCGDHYSEVRLNLWFSIPDQLPWELGKPCLYLCLLWLGLVISWVGMEISSPCWALADKLLISTLRKHRGDNWFFSLLLCGVCTFSTLALVGDFKLAWNLIHGEILVCHFIKVGNENRFFSLISIFNQFHMLAFSFLKNYLLILFVSCLFQGGSLDLILMITQ